MNKYKLVLFLLLVIGCFCGGYFMGEWLDKSYPVHEGIEAFEGERELQGFKTDMVHKGLMIRRLDVISSEPVVVDFEIVLPSEYQFDWGTVHYDKTNRIAFTLIYGLIGSIFLGFGFYGRD